MKRASVAWVVVLLSGCAGVGATRPTPSAAAAPVQPAGTLFARLGGLDGIKAVVPRFLEHVTADERINYFFALSDLHALEPKLVEFFCAATGGPCAYTGRDMRSAHASLAIGPGHFNALVEDLSRTLDEFHVPARDKNELLAALGPLRGDIVSSR